MSLRTYKKRAKQARDQLIAEGHAKPSHFYTFPKTRFDDDNLVCSSQDVVGSCKTLGSFYALYGTPVHLPEALDYWGEANDPKCCIDLLREIHFWEENGDRLLAELQAEIDREDAAKQALALVGDE